MKNNKKKQIGAWIAIIVLLLATCMPMFLLLARAKMLVIISGQQLELPLLSLFLLMQCGWFTGYWTVTKEREEFSGGKYYF